MELGLSATLSAPALAIGPLNEFHRWRNPIERSNGIHGSHCDYSGLSLKPQMPATSFAIPLSSVRRPSNSFLLSPHCYEGDTEQIPYRFTVVREESRELSTSTRSHSSYRCVDCRWHLPLWLLFFGATVSILTLLFLLTGSMYPIHGWWTRYGSQSLGVLKGIYRGGHSPSAFNDTVSHPLAPVSHVEPCRVFARSTRSGDFIVPSTVMRRPSTSGPAFLVDNSVRASWSLGGAAVAVAHLLAQKPCF